MSLCPICRWTQTLVLIFNCEQAMIICRSQCIVILRFLRASPCERSCGERDSVCRSTDYQCIAFAAYNCATSAECDHRCSTLAPASNSTSIVSKCHSCYNVLTHVCNGPRAVRCRAAKRERAMNRYFENSWFVHGRIQFIGKNGRE